MGNQWACDKGLIQLALRSGQLAAINVREVKAGEIVGEDFVSGELQFKQLDPSIRDNAPIIGYVAYFRLLNGFSKMFFMTYMQIMQHAQKFSKAVNTGPWATDTDAMCRKTVLKLLLNRWCPMSVEMQQACKYDQAVIKDENGEPEYLDNPSNEGETPVEVIEARTEYVADAIMGAAEPQKQPLPPTEIQAFLQKAQQQKAQAQQQDAFVEPSKPRPSVDAFLAQQQAAQQKAQGQPQKASGEATLLDTKAKK